MLGSKDCQFCLSVIFFVVKHSCVFRRMNMSRFVRLHELSKQTDGSPRNTSFHFICICLLIISL